MSSATFQEADAFQLKLDIASASFPYIVHNTSSHHINNFDDYARPVPLLTLTDQKVIETILPHQLSQNDYESFWPDKTKLYETAPQSLLDRV